MSATKDQRGSSNASTTTTTKNKETALVMRHIIVSGKVQGVFYRKHAQQTATQLGVTGWVRNNADGRVEIVAEGSPEQVDAFEMWCHTGSPKSAVKSVVSDKVTAEVPVVMRRFDVFSVVK